MSALIVFATHGYEGIDVFILVFICFNLKLEALKVLETLEKDVQVDSLYFLASQEVMKLLNSRLLQVVSTCYTN